MNKYRYNLRYYRKLCRYNFKILSLDAQVSVAHLKAIEYGYRSPSLEVATRIWKAFARAGMPRSVSMEKLFLVEDKREEEHGSFSRKFVH